MRFSIRPSCRRDLPYRLLLARNLSWICEEAGGMVSLAGSSVSKGAKAETQVAWACELPRWVHMADDTFLPADGPGKKLGRVE